MSMWFWFSLMFSLPDQTKPLNVWQSDITNRPRFVIGNDVIETPSSTTETPASWPPRPASTVLRPTCVADHVVRFFEFFHPHVSPLSCSLSLSRPLGVFNEWWQHFYILKQTFYVLRQTFYNLKSSVILKRLRNDWRCLTGGSPPNRTSIFGFRTFVIFPCTGQ